MKQILLTLFAGLLAHGCTEISESVVSSDSFEPFRGNVVCTAIKETVVSVFDRDGEARVTAFASDSDRVFRIVDGKLQATADLGFISGPCEVDRSNMRMTCAPKDWPFSTFLLRFQTWTFVLQTEEFVGHPGDGDGRHRTIAGHCESVGG